MAIRTIIHIDGEKCTGCGLCAQACHEGAIGMVDGKARLLKDEYCDGLGDCLPACPAGAITFVEREAADYDEAAVAAAKGAAAVKVTVGADAKAAAADGDAKPTAVTSNASTATAATPAAAANTTAAIPAPAAVPSEISTWPIQIKLLPLTAPYFDGCDLLVAADCTAFAYGNFHHDFMRGKVTVIGCPKLDAVDYADKLGSILAQNDIRSIHIARMTVPCCGGLQNAVSRAIAHCGKDIPVAVTTFGLDGDILSQE